MPQLPPLIIEPHADTRRANPKRGEFLLYDEDFELETRPRFRPIDPAAKLYIPHFSLGDIGPWIFAKNANWVRHQIKKAPLYLGEELLTIRAIKGRGNQPERRFTLADIERFAWALNQRNDIDGLTLKRASDILVAVAGQYQAAKAAD
ncbi:hypothetical protein ABZS76_33340 [Streptomyces sp. NPDC005562]|uniref:hypothetical protein n=1 Tax=Streptomyces sp. NPDC005562 TaxID=3154890 RepID=UPI00339EC112